MEPVAARTVSLRHSVREMEQKRSHSQRMVSVQVDCHTVPGSCTVPNRWSMEAGCGSGTALTWCCRTGCSSRLLRDEQDLPGNREKEFPGFSLSDTDAAREGLDHFSTFQAGIG